MNSTQMSLQLDLPETGSSPQTSYSVARRARALVSLVSGLARRTPDSVGPRPYELLAICGPDGSYLRTHGGSPLRRRGGSSVPYTAPSRRWDIAWGGELGALPSLEHRTGGIAASSSDGWPTPRVAADRTSMTALTRDGHWAAPSLGQMVELAGGELPREFADASKLTPQARRVYEAAMWPTPMAAGSERSSQTMMRGNPTLIGAVKMWPTPTVTDAGSGRVNQSASEGAAERPTLGMMARRGLWPTPSGSDSEGGKIRKGMGPTGQMPDGRKAQVGLNQAVTRLWPSGRATDGEKGGPSQRGSKGDLMLPSAVNRPWRTPQARDSISRGAQTPEKRDQGDHSIGLGDQTGGQLNPRWTLQLMGLPSNYLDFHYSPPKKKRSK